MIRVSLNEKIWFGKYKGNRMKDIIDNHPKHINEILKNRVKLDDDCEKYLKSKSKSWNYNTIGKLPEFILPNS